MRINPGRSKAGPATRRCAFCGEDMQANDEVARRSGKSGHQQCAEVDRRKRLAARYRREYEEWIRTEGDHCCAPTASSRRSTQEHQDVVARMVTKIMATGSFPQAK